MRWAVALADVRLGQGDSVTRFAARRIAGRNAPHGMAGELAGASGKIGAVPLEMSEIDGRWRWAGGVLIWLGMWVMAWNLWYTAADARHKIIQPIPVPIPEPEPDQVPVPLPAAG